MFEEEEDRNLVTQKDKKYPEGGKSQKELNFSFIHSFPNEEGLQPF